MKIEDAAGDTKRKRRRWGVREERWRGEHFRGDRIEKWSGDAGANQEVLQ